MVGQQNADIADTLQLRDVAIATIFLHWQNITDLSTTYLWI